MDHIKPRSRLTIFYASNFEELEGHIDLGLSVCQSVGLSVTPFVGWLVVLGFNGSLRQYFSLYRAVSQREGEEERKDR